MLLTEVKAHMGLLVYAWALFICSQLLSLLWTFLGIFSLAEYTVGTSVGFCYQESTPGLFVCEISLPAGSKDVSPFFVVQAWAWFCQVPMETEFNYKSLYSC